jgi:hypothetical protein
MPRKKKESESNILNGLSEDQRIALHFQHFDGISELKEEIASLVGSLRAKRKEAKADLGADGLAEIDEAIKQATPEGEAKAKTRMDIMMRVARWHGSNIGAQLSILDTLPPRDFQAEGKLAGLRGLAGRPPDGLGQGDAQLWLEGYHIGQGVLAEGFGRKPGAEGDAEQKAAVDGAARDAEAAASGKRKRGRPKKIAQVSMPLEGEPIDPNAGHSAGDGDDQRDFRPDYARPENQQHPKDTAPAIGTEPSTTTTVRH